MDTRKVSRSRELYIDRENCKIELPKNISNSLILVETFHLEASVKETKKLI